MSRKRAYVKGERAEVKTQIELEAAIKAEAWPIVVLGDAYFEFSGNAQATLYGNARATLYGNARATLYGNAQATLYGNARATATGVAQVIVAGRASVIAGPHNAVTRLIGHVGQVDGGIVIQQPPVRTAEDWCAYHGVPVHNGVAIVYKGVNDDYSSPRGALYTPGTQPVAADWDGDTRECGGGLHFSPSPLATRQFHADAERFIACPVALADMRAPQDSDRYPNKVKARGCCAPVYEVNSFGEPVAVKPAEATA